MTNTNIDLSMDHIVEIYADLYDKTLESTLEIARNTKEYAQSNELQDSRMRLMISTKWLKDHKSYLTSILQLTYTIREIFDDTNSISDAAMAPKIVSNTSKIIENIQNRTPNPNDMLADEIGAIKSKEPHYLRLFTDGLANVLNNWIVAQYEAETIKQSQHYAEMNIAEILKLQRSLEITNNISIHDFNYGQNDSKNFKKREIPLLNILNIIPDYYLEIHNNEYINDASYQTPNSRYTNDFVINVTNKNVIKAWGDNPQIIISPMTPKELIDILIINKIDHGIIIQMIEAYRKNVPESFATLKLLKNIAAPEAENYNNFQFDYSYQTKRQSAWSYQPSWDWESFKEYIKIQNSDDNQTFDKYYNIIKTLKDLKKPFSFTAAKQLVTYICTLPENKQDTLVKIFKQFIDDLSDSVLTDSVVEQQIKNRKLYTISNLLFETSRVFINYHQRKIRYVIAGHKE